MSQQEKYRKSDQYYIDEYDRDTIAQMKLLENEMLTAEQRFAIDPEDLKSPLNNTDYIGLRMKYIDTGVMLSRNKRQTIDEQMKADEWKDQIVKKHIIPDNILCLYCAENMNFEFFDFNDKERTFLLWFACPDGHAPKRAFYNNGVEFKPQEKVCNDCGGALNSTTKKTKKKLTIIETCGNCKKKDVIVIDIPAKKPILPIDEVERKKYCTDFIRQRTFLEDLESLAKLSELTEEENAKQKYEFKNVQKINIPQVEEILNATLDRTGFIKLQFDTPKISRYLTVGISVQDSTDRDATKSIKALKKIVETTLFPTNWRLMSPGFEYRLGFLSGQLKGFSLDEDLLKIAQEIWEKKKEN